MQYDESACLYCGVLGTVESFPKIVVHRNLCWKRSSHHIVVIAPNVGPSRDLTFDVKDGTHVILMLDRDGIKASVSYGTVVFL